MNTTILLVIDLTLDSRARSIFPRFNQPLWSSAFCAIVVLLLWPVPSPPETHQAPTPATTRAVAASERDSRDPTGPVYRLVAADLNAVRGED